MAWAEQADVDIAIMPLADVVNKVEAAGTQLYYKSIPHTLIPTEEQIVELDVLEEVLFVGYPSGIYDSKNLMPIMRRGTSATPMQLDYEGRPVFLIDASVFPGSSGSPVFLYNRGTYATRHGTTIGSRIFLLGVLSQAYYQEEERHIKLVTTPTTNSQVVKSQQMIDLGVVCKARLVTELVIAGLKEAGKL